MLHSLHMGHFLLTSSLTSAEISALRLDGELSRHHELWDEIQSWKTRSFHVLSKEKHPLVLTGLSAAWALGVGDEPLNHCASTITTRRIRRAENPVLKIEERSLDASEIWRSKNVGVTSPLRTITDVMKTELITTEQWHYIPRELMDSHSITIEQVIASIESMNFVPHKQRALNRAYQLKTSLQKHDKRHTQHQCAALR